MTESQRKIVLVITPHKKGGPWRWGADLVKELNETAEFKAEHIFEIKNKLLAPFKFNASLIHTTNPLAFSVLAKPLILTVHGKVHGWFWKFFYRLAYWRASAVTVPSEFLKKFLSFKKALVIPNAVDFSEFNQVNLADRGFFNILTVTKFWFPKKAKGLFELALVIFDLSKSFDKKINWRIVGSGPLLENTRKSISALERPANLNVQWFGFDLPEKYFSDSDIFAYFSYEDNMPIAIMEAMASGLPVVTNEIGAVSEIIDSGRDGFVAKNHSDYGETMLKLVNDFDLRQKIGAAAREKIRTKFDWPIILPQWLELYKKIIK